MMECDQAKLFVGGISWETNEDTLKEHFGKYGNVVGSVVARDRITGSSRGFGFVWFSDASSADKALQDTHIILRRTVEVKKAVPRSEQHQIQQQQQQTDQQQNGGSSRYSSDASGNNQFRTKKIFVGGLAASLTEEEFKNYFERFGRITDVVVMHDSSTNRPRGFGFITFDSEESVENVMQNSFHELSGKRVEVKRAVPKEGNNNGNNGYNMRVGGVRGSPFNSYQHGNFAPYGPRYGIYPGYAPLSGYGGGGGGGGGYLYGASVYGGAYPMGGYGGIGYWFPPVAPRSPWNGPGAIGARGCLLPYGNTTFYPAYMNGGVGLMGMAGGFHDGIAGPAVNVKLMEIGDSDAGVPADATPPPD
ncbi:hypothetical protein L1049_025856 [Liquidambar formosana]|uniref:RRM domain-containing protein n=1 Tax=Liquidambar formosana TaxID=63359 RepID=A0AAP0NFB6_LIQFO